MSNAELMHKLENFTAMTLLIMTVQFLVKCHVIFGVIFSCVNTDKNAYKKAHPNQYYTNYEAKTTSSFFFCGGGGQR